MRAAGLPNQGPGIDPLRGQREPAELEIITDSLGVFQLYYTDAGSGQASRSSVQVLKNLLVLNEPDPFGTASHLSIGWSWPTRPWYAVSGMRTRHNADDADAHPI
jgi:hypothetical protein